MADWDTTTCDNITTVDYNNHSRQSSQGSGFSAGSKENTNTADDSSHKMLILTEGSDLTGESRTEATQSVYYDNQLSSNSSIPQRSPLAQGPGYGTAKAKAAKSPFTAPPIESVPVEEITVPNDANISSFTSVQFANFLKFLKIEDRIISHLHRKSVDGKRFSKMTDTELETLGMKNPVILFFRNKSSVKGKKKGPFML